MTTLQQLVKLIGHNVEATDHTGNTRRFRVGQGGTGLMLECGDDLGGEPCPADGYQTVRDLGVAKAPRIQRGRP